MQKIWKFFIDNARFTYLLVVVIAIMGLWSLLSIPKESSPEVEVPFGIVTTILPGASPADIEELVTVPIEEEIKTITTVKTHSSTSQQSVSTIMVEFEASADLDKSIRELEQAVDRAQAKLPSEAEDPRVLQVDFVNQPILMTAVSLDTAPGLFSEIAEELEDELRAVRGVSRVEIAGVQNDEIQVTIPSEALVSRNISLDVVSQAIRTWTSSHPIGVTETDGMRYSVSLLLPTQSIDELEAIPVRSLDGVTYRLGDIADITSGIEERSSITHVSVNGEPVRNAITVSVFKRSGEDITRVSRDVRNKLRELADSELLQNAVVVSSYDAGELVQTDLSNLGFSAFQTGVLVFIILWLAVGTRESLIASIAIPLSFLLTFIGLYASGNTINFVSLFSLILAVGVLVDTSIVITEGIHQELREGKDPQSAAFAALKAYSAPLISGTLTTVAVFVPLFFISGITGEFIKSIPFTIVFVLLSSLFVSLAIVPTVATHYLKDETKQGKSERFFDRLSNWYEKKLSFILGRKRREKYFLGGMVALLFVSLLLPIFGLVKVEFFPIEDGKFIYVDIEAPRGSTLEATEDLLLQIEDVLVEEPYFSSFIATAGSGSIFGNASTGSSLANITINLIDGGLSSGIIARDLQEKLEKVTRAEIRVSQPESGPPVGAPVLIKVSGDDLDTLSLAAESVTKTLSETEGAINVVGPTTGGAEIAFVVDPRRAGSLGINPSSVAQNIRTALIGTEVASIRTNDKDIPIRMYLVPTLRETTRGELSADEILALPVQTQTGAAYVQSVAEPTLLPEQESINHSDGVRTIQVTSDITPGTTVPTVVSAFQERINNVELPEGVTISIGGETEETNQSFAEMFYALIAGTLLMFVILLLEFNSYRYTAYILIIIPFSLIGILFGLMLTGKALSFPSLMGIIALAGIIVNNSIILIDRMNILRKQGMGIRDAVVSGAISRLRPILLTSLTTIIGLVPLTYASGLWSPLAWAMIFGLAFSVVLTLVIVPVLYHRWPGKARS